MFGPSYLNFYGRPREIMENYSKFDYLNQGWVNMGFWNLKFDDLFKEDIVVTILIHYFHLVQADISIWSKRNLLIFKFSNLSLLKSK